MVSDLPPLATDGEVVLAKLILVSRDGPADRMEVAIPNDAQELTTEQVKALAANPDQRTIHFDGVGVRAFPPFPLDEFKDIRLQIREGHQVRSAIFNQVEPLGHMRRWELESWATLR